MTALPLIYLALAGLVGGFLAGLIGIGGGVVFAPVLFVYLQHIGTPAELVTPMVLGSSLLCTFAAAASSAGRHHANGAVRTKLAVRVGLLSAVFLFLTTRLVTTKPWYDGEVFQVVFGLVLLAVTVRMLLDVFGKKANDEPAQEERTGWGASTGIAAAAGGLAAAAGVGGGVVLVPGYNKGLRLPLREAVGTSSATIVLISLAGVLSYAYAGWGVDAPGLTLGYVDLQNAAGLAIPALIGARIGARVAHRVSRRVIRLTFAVFALGIAIRLLAG
ncbi:MAG: sulfite exporter TauE/SafE family protein [Bacteroidota bacterium]